MNDAPARADYSAAADRGSWENRLLDLSKYFKNDERLKQLPIWPAASKAVEECLSNLHRLQVYYRSKIKAASPADYIHKSPPTLREFHKLQDRIALFQAALLEQEEIEESPSVLTAELAAELRDIREGLVKAYDARPSTLAHLLYFPLPPPGSYDDAYPPTFMEISPEIHPWLTKGVADLQGASSTSESAIKSYFEEQYGEDKLTVADDLWRDVDTLRANMQSLDISVHTVADVQSSDIEEALRADMRSLNISDRQASGREQQMPGDDRKWGDLGTMLGPALLALVGDQKPGQNNDSSSTFFLPPNKGLSGPRLGLPDVDYTTVTADEGSLEQLAIEDALTMLRCISMASNKPMKDVQTDILSRLTRSVSWVGRLAQSFEDPKYCGPRFEQRLNQSLWPMNLGSKLRGSP